MDAFHPVDHTGKDDDLLVEGRDDFFQPACHVHGFDGDARPLVVPAEPFGPIHNVLDNLDGSVDDRGRVGLEYYLVIL